jgi:hypothetical protein
MAKHLKFSALFYRLTLAVLVVAVLASCTSSGSLGNSTSGLSAAAQNSQQAQLKSAVGMVEIQTGAGWSPLPIGEKTTYLEAGQHVRTGDLSSVQISFADGSLVDLNANSEIAIDKLQVGTKSQSRTIALTQLVGASQHTVALSSITASSYEVHTAGGTASAKGTQFSVRVLPDQTAYINVVAGAVIVIAAQVTVTLNPGQMTFFIFNQPPALPLPFLEGEGPVTQTGEEWIIAGLTFKATPDTIQVGLIQPGDIVHFMGHLLPDGTRILDLVILLQPSPANTFRLQGAVESISDSAWIVNGTAIALTPQTQIEPGIAAGDLVWVEGVILTSGIFQADRIIKAAEELGLPFEFTGSVQEIGTENWTIAGIRISVEQQTVIGEGIEPGKLVFVSGRIQPDGAWLAASIRLADEQERQFEFTGEISSMAPWTVAGISFETRSWTKIDLNLKAGDRVSVSGFIETSGIWVAVEIHLVAAPETRLILIGPVLSVEPWIVSGVSLKTTAQTIIIGSITVGMLVRVEARLLEDGSWEAIQIEPLAVFVWIPGCLDLTVVVISLQGSLIQFQGWPQMTLPEGFSMDGQFVPNETVTVHMCFSATLVIQIITITVIIIPSPELPDETGMVLICHKPDKKNGGKTMSLPRSALGGHLGHGDTLGACP